MRASILLVPFAALLIAAPAHADRDFGEHIWLEATTGFATFTGVDRSDGALAGRSVVGIRIADDWGLELGVDAVSDPFDGVGASGLSVAVAFIPDEAVRIRMGARTRSFSIRPGFQLDLFGDNDTPFTGAETVDLGVVFGVLSQWNWGPFFVGVEWFGIYQPVAVLMDEYVFYQGEMEIGRAEADWGAQELPAELRFLNLTMGLTF